MNEQKILTGKGITVAVLDTGIFPHMILITGLWRSGIWCTGGRRLTMIMGMGRMSAESSAEAGEHPAGSTGVRHRNADFW